MAENKYRKINIGRIAGLSSYELAIKLGTFEGTEEEYVAKEQSVYDHMVEYCENFKLSMGNVDSLPQKVLSRMNDLGEIKVDELDTIYESYSDIGDFHKTSDGKFVYTCTSETSMYIGFEDGTYGIQLSLDWVYGLRCRRKTDEVWSDWGHIITGTETGEGV